MKDAYRRSGYPHTFAEFAVHSFVIDPQTGICHAIADTDAIVSVLGHAVFPTIRLIDGVGTRYVLEKVVADWCDPLEDGGFKIQLCPHSWKIERPYNPRPAQ